MQDIIVQGVRSAVREGAPKGREGDATAVVFVHGNPGSSEDWSTLLPQVGQFARAIAPDMPGYGQADRPRDFDYTVAGYGRHLEGILVELGVDRVHLVLHDFGGAWGLWLAAQNPQRVASVTLINIGAMPGYTWHKFARLWRTPIVGELFQLGAIRPAFKFLLNADNPKPFPDAFVDRMHADADWPMKRAVLKLYRATDDLGGVSVALAEVLKPHRIPALVLWGEGDAYLPVRYAEVQREYFDAEVHLMPGCGHWPMIDEPDKVSELVLPFLQRHAG